MKSTGNPLKLLTLALLSFALSAPAHAAVITAGDTLSGESQSNFDGTSYTTTGTIDAGSAANSILIVGYGGEFQGSNDNLTGVSYGGQALTQAVVSPSEFTRSHIWYLTDPAQYSSSDNLELTFTNNEDRDDWFVTAAVFSGVDLNAPFLDTANNYENSAASGGVLSYDLGSSSVDTTIFEAIYINSGATTANLFDTYLYNSSGSAQTAGYDAITDSGTVDRNYIASVNNNASAAGVALTPIPEPSAGTLVMLSGGLLVLLRRRKSFFS